MSKHFPKPFALALLGLMFLGVAPPRAAADDTPSLEGTWRWEGDDRNDDRRLVLTQDGMTVKGKINYRDGKVANRGRNDREGWKCRAG
jgi:hypothetical protein